MDVFAALSYLSSQVLVAAIRPDAISALAAWHESERRTAWARSASYVQIACFCGSCSWHVPAEVLANQVYDASETMQAVAGDAYARWLQARFGVKVPRIEWLWLPTGSQDSSDDPSTGSLGCGVSLQAEPLPEAAGHAAPSVHPRDGGRVGGPPALARTVVRRFRCRICRALTHAEVRDLPDARSKGDLGEPRAQPAPRTALVCSYNLLRLARAEGVSVASFSGGGPEYWGTALARRCGGAGQESPPSGLRPPARMHATPLAEFILPRVT